MYNNQETSGKIPVAEWTQPVHDPNKWMWIEDDTPSALIDVYVSELSVHNDLKPQQL